MGPPVEQGSHTSYPWILGAWEDTPSKVRPYLGNRTTLQIHPTTLREGGVRWPNCSRRPWPSKVGTREGSHEGSKPKAGWSRHERGDVG